MNKFNTYIELTLNTFFQLSTFFNRSQFNNYVRKYDGNRYVKHFTCWNQLLTAMMFGQLSNRESLRGLIIALEAHQGKRYHLGLGRDPLPKPRLHQPIRIGIAESSKTLLST